MSQTFRLVDLSHVVEQGMITYPGLPGPVLRDHVSREASRARYAPGTEFHIGLIEMVANTGTYVDSPFHRFAEGRDLSELPLESLAHLDGVVVRVDERGVTARSFAEIDVRGKAVLVHTGWDRHWGTDAYFRENPFVSRDAAEHLRDSGAALVGIDSMNIDDKHDLTRPAHTILLQANIPVVEHLCNLAELPPRGFRFYAVPVKVKRFGTFPVRAFAVLGLK
jgi:kynurenine formamidase